jgi:hypothetical protein
VWKVWHRITVPEGAELTEKEQKLQRTSKKYGKRVEITEKEQILQKKSRNHKERAELQRTSRNSKERAENTENEQQFQKEADTPEQEQILQEKPEITENRGNRSSLDCTHVGLLETVRRGRPRFFSERGRVLPPLVRCRPRAL